MMTALLVGPVTATEVCSDSNVIPDTSKLSMDQPNYFDFSYSFKINRDRVGMLKYSNFNYWLKNHGVKILNESSWESVEIALQKRGFSLDVVLHLRTYSQIQTDKLQLHAKRNSGEIELIKSGVMDPEDNIRERLSPYLESKRVTLPFVNLLSQFYNGNQDQIKVRQTAYIKREEMFGDDYLYDLSLDFDYALVEMGLMVVEGSVEKTYYTGAGYIGGMISFEFVLENKKDVEHIFSELLEDPSYFFEVGRFRVIEKK